MSPEFTVIQLTDENNNSKHSARGTGDPRALGHSRGLMSLLFFKLFLFISDCSGSL